MSVRAHFALLFAASVACSPPPRAAEAPPPASPIDAANRAFHTDYDRMRDEEQAKVGVTRPFIFCDGPTVTLRYRGKELKRRLWVPRYQNLKGLTHITVGAVSTLLVMPAGPPSAADAAHLRAIDAQLVEVERSIVPDAVGAELVDAERRVIAATRALLGEALAGGRPSEERIRAYGKSIRADVIANLTAASGVLVDALHAAVNEMKAEVGPEAWSQLVVLVSTAHQARAREISVQYFERLVGDHMAEGAVGEQRLVVTEGSYKNGVPEARMAAHIVDQRLGVLLFDDPLLMQRDVMGNFVGVHLDRLFPAH